MERAGDCVLGGRAPLLPAVLCALLPPARMDDETLVPETNATALLEDVGRSGLNFRPLLVAVAFIDIIVDFNDLFKVATVSFAVAVP